MVIEQNTFIGGLDLINPDTQVNMDSYCWLVNARARFGYVEPIPTPLELTTAPSGLKQGIIAVGNSFVAFIAGRAWYKLYTESQWIQVPNFAMSSSVTLIYSQAIPASSRDYTRKLNPSGSVTDAMLYQVSSRGQGMPQGIVCQDGVTKPWLITFNEVTNVFAARQLKGYSGWTLDDPEYVPVGLQMMFLNQKLFIVSPDGASIYHSVTGAPLNFMVNVDTTGQKLATEAQGGADSISFAFDYDPITCIQPVNVTDSFIYATKNNTRVLTLNYLITVFGEPTYSTAAIIDTGVTNQYALTDLNGDYAFINTEGLRSFNAVQQLKFEGRNSVFSKGVSRLFPNIRQDYGVAFSYDNYNIFNVKTVSGVMSVIYDSITSAWVSLDIADIGQIRQVAHVDLATETRVYAITMDDKIYHLFNKYSETSIPHLFTRGYSVAGAVNATPGSYTINNPITDIKSQKLDLIFRDGTAEGTVTCTEYCDGVLAKTLTKSLEAPDVVTPYPALPAIQPLIEPQGSRVTFNFNNTKRGFKLSYLISWNSDAALMKLRLVTTDIDRQTSDGQRSSSLA